MTIKMLDNPTAAIQEYIKTLTPPLEREAIYRHFRALDSTITRGDISRALRDAGFAAKRMRGGDTSSGVCQRWVRVESKLEEQEPEKTEPKTTEQIIEDVETRNDKNSDLNTRLLESLKISRDLKAEMLARQREALVSMARQVLSLLGDDYEQQRYKP